MRKTLAAVATTGIVLLAPGTAAYAAPPQTAAPVQTTETTVDDEGDKTGLWGLLGLLGLAGLIKRRETTDTTDRR